MKTPIRAVIFDADGTILDTRELIFSAYEHALSAHGHPIPSREEIARHGGMTLEACYKAFVPDGDHETLCDTHHEFQMQRFDLLEGYDGVHDLFAALKKAGLKIAICTSRGGNVADLLKAVGVHEFCDAIVTKDDVTKHKPDPEVVLKALELLDVSADEVVMVGDTDAHIGAGKNAHLAATIGVTHGLGTRESLVAAGADHIIDHISAVFPIVVVAEK